MLRATAMLIPLLAAAFGCLGGCGDDGMTAPRGVPAAPPPPDSLESTTIPVPPAAPVTPIPTGSPPAVSGAREQPPSSWATTRVGDWATWEIRVVGSDSVTKLTWRATGVDGRGVRHSVEARTLDVTGETKSLVRSDELHVVAHETGVNSAHPGDTLTVAGRALATQKWEAPREGKGVGARTTIWISSDVPFTGIAKSSNADIEQVLMAFGRGP